MPKAERAAVFAALGDPTRLGLVARLADGRRLSITNLASGTPMTRQAVGRHLRVLENAGLLVAERSGRETRYGLEHRRLTEAASWIREVASQWEENLARLQEHLRDGDD